MSSPIHDGSISPNDPSYYAPRRSGADAKSSLTDQLASPAALATTDSWSARIEDAEVIVPFPRAREYLNVFDRGTRKTWRTKALVVSGIAVAVLTGGIAFFGSAGIAPQVSEKRTPQEPEPSLASRLQTAAVDIQKAAQQVVTPTLVVNESAGEMDAPLALGLEVKNYTPGAVIALSGVPAGTIISNGAAEGDRRWRIAADDLPNAMVTPPSGFTGVMTIMAELRIGKDLPIVRSPVRLTWRAASASAAPAPSSATELSPARTTAADRPARHLDARESASLLRRAEELKAAGDLAAARLLLQRVAETNNARAAFELAETYDPIAIKKAGGSSVTADSALAQHWYQRAREWGLPSGSQELEAIASRAAAHPK